MTHLISLEGSYSNITDLKSESGLVCSPTHKQWDDVATFKRATLENGSFSMVQNITGYKSNTLLSFKMSFGSPWSIMMDISVSGDCLEKNAHDLLAFHIILRALHQMR
ncbi:hypothetical protein TNCV_2929121 [Trichonephila clavipes]|nr:hypothetical protein TNCV_2929121 [Trichonephila clavipes]